MKNKLFMGILAIVMCFGLVGCEKDKLDDTEKNSCNSDGLEVITGEIKEINNPNYTVNENQKGTILINIISGLDLEDDIIIYHNSNIEFKIGQKVRITYNGNINQSNPPQAGAECIELLNDDTKLNDVYNKVGDYFGDENADRSNLAAYALDTEKNVVVVMLIDNSKEKQESFKKLAKIKDYSEYLDFEQGGPITAGE